MSLMPVSQPKSRTGTPPHLVLCTLKLTRPRKNQVSFGRSKCDGCSIYFTLSYFILHIHSFLVCWFTVLINVFRILSSPVFKVMSKNLEFYHTECSFTASYVTRARTIGKSLKSKNGKKNIHSFFFFQSCQCWFFGYKWKQEDKNYRLWEEKKSAELTEMAVFVTSSVTRSNQKNNSKTDLFLHRFILRN